MRKLLTILTFALAFICTASHAQTVSGKVTGTVIDGSQKIIESATITLLKSSDSSVTKIGVADKNGRFEFDGVASGTYLVSISAIGHEKAYSEAFQVTKDKPAVSLKKIELITQAKSLTGVTITSKKPLIEQKIDRTVVNVEASVTNVGNSALEVLEKSPGVTVDKDGNISLKGKQGVQIYIDGRPAYLSGQDLANMLKSMSASQLEQIEIMTNPPAKYDAAGNSGVINIKTKKNKQFGYNGSISTGYTQAKYARFNDGVNFNYRNGKVNVFTSLNYNHDRRAQQLNIERNFRDINTKQLVSSFSQQSMMNNKSDFYSAKAGLDYSVSKKTTLGVVLNGFHSPRKWDGKTYTDIYDPSGNLESKTFALSNSNSAWNNYSANLNLRHTIDSAGQEITSDFDYIRYNSKDDGSLVSSYFDMNGIPTQVPDTLLNSLPQHISIYSGKIDYTLPLKKGAKFEAGLKS
ncbi:MAG: TonB-dependent receptor, partial [Bacteroidetes bacterium]|nr:TonB-dependent receptor [Bacteroidota bacterium]